MKERFSAEERVEILAFVRACIGAELAGSPMPPVPQIALLAEHGSCFVTLKERGALRGCIGNIQAVEKLGANLRRNALNAAFQDPRFRPLDPGEFGAIEIEVSILTPLQAIPSYEEFHVGEDGIILQESNRSAVFLPQVAPEQGWDCETTLTYLAQKAGLPADAWKRSTAKFFTFQAEVFHE